MHWDEHTFVFSSSGDFTYTVSHSSPDIPDVNKSSDLKPA